MSRPDVLVVGGGVIGASCAYWLTDAGANVTLLERFGLAAGTSSACQSNVGASLGVGSELSYMRTAVAGYAELRERGLALGWKLTPRLLVAITGPEIAALREDVRVARAAGARVELCDDDPRRVEPRLAPSIPAVAVELDGAQVNPMQVAIELARHALRMGAKIMTGVEAVRLRRTGDRVVGVDTVVGPLSAAIVVVAAGPWSRKLVATAGLRLPVFPRKGHILVTEPLRRWTGFNITGYGYETTLGHGFGAADAEPPQDEPEVGTVLLPTPEGQMLLGSSRESVGWDNIVSRDRLRAIARAGIAMLPSLAEVRVVRTYAGLRPWSPDGQPLLGPVEEADGLWVATGHSGGITGAPVAGRLIADLMFGRTPHIDPNPFRPGRFSLTAGGALPLES